MRPAFLRVVLADSLRAGLHTLYRAGTQLLGDNALGEELALISAPTLLLWGERDPLVPLSLADEYERAITDAKLVVLAGAGHVAMADRPAEFADALLRFVCER
jgi:pimeloyl-ACP methyl ester carboxylesterase